MNSTLRKDADAIIASSLNAVCRTKLSAALETFAARAAGCCWS